MSLGDIAIAMQGLSRGAAQFRENERRTQVEDENFRRQTAENDHFEAMRPLEIESAQNRNRLSGSQANVAEQTEAGVIESRNVQNQDTIAKYNQRLADGVSAKEAKAELSAAEREIVENHLAEDRAAALNDAGAPEAEAQAAVTSANATTSNAERNIEKNDIAKRIGLDKTIAYAEKSEAALRNTESRRKREDILTDEMNGYYANAAVARAAAGESARRMEEVNLKLVKSRQNSNFDQLKFARENQNEIMGAAVDAAYAAGIGGDAAVNALPLINMDADGDGRLDFEGATSTAIRNIEGKNYLVAVDDSGNIVPSSSAPDSPGMEVAAIREWADRNQSKGKSKTGSAGAGKAGKPVKLTDIDDLDDLSYDLLNDSFGLQADEDDDSVFTSLEGAVPVDFEESGEGMMPSIQNDISAFLSRAQQDGASIAEARLAIDSPSSLATNLYGLNTAGMQAAQAMANTNATTKALELARADGQDVDPNNPPAPTQDAVEQELNKLLITMMSQAEPKI